MRLILDTYTFLWLASAPTRLSRLAVDLIADPENEAMLSAVSAWEIGVKHALGRLPLPQGLSPGAFIPEARVRHRRLAWEWAEFSGLGGGGSCAAAT